MKALISILVMALTLTLTFDVFAASDEITAEMNKLFPPHKADPSMRMPPGMVELKSPSFFQKIDGDKVTLEWSAAEGADSYHLQIATDAAFKWIFKNEYGVTGTTFEVTGLEKGKQYFWRVLSINNKNQQIFTKSPFKASMFQTN